LTDLLLANRAEVLRGLENVAMNLADMRGMLESGDRAGLRALLETGPGVSGDVAR
jgi:hypothetical protein